MSCRQRLEQALGLRKIGPAVVGDARASWSWCRWALRRWHSLAPAAESGLSPIARCWGVQGSGQGASELRSWGGPPARILGEMGKLERVNSTEAQGFGKAPKKKAPKDEKEEGESTETGIVKDKSSAKSKALSKQRLSDLRDKTLALRQKREEELDEYEMGKAMIAKYGPEVAVMPQPVAERVAKRGMVIGGSFYATMLAVFAFGIVLFKTQEIVIPPTLMAFVTLALLALAIFGGSYGMMSASWDPDKEGSALGTEDWLLGRGRRWWVKSRAKKHLLLFCGLGVHEPFFFLLLLLFCSPFFNIYIYIYTNLIYRYICILPQFMHGTEWCPPNGYEI
ncbi:unnamed protein product [Effrenium voratum]|nr:unnamed protein product [Effrenium voratum]